MTLVNIETAITEASIAAEAKYAAATAQTLTNKQAQAIAHSLSQTSKMPCASYGLPPEACITGSKLRQVAGSICSHCYACKGSYQMYKAIKPAQNARLASITHPLWSAAMVKLISSSTSNFGAVNKLFRWHDSGDLQSVAHLARIVAIARALPSFKFWMPTREVAILQAYERMGLTIPKNLIIRVSAAKVDAPAPIYLTGFGSTAHTSSPRPGAIECSAYKRGGECGKCRMCFNTKIAAVSYPLH